MADADLLGGVMRLMKSVDLDAIVRDAQGAGDDLDSMISTVTKSMLKGIQPADAAGHTITVSLADAHRGKRRRIRVRTDDDAAAATYDVDVPARCADRHTVVVATPHGSIDVLVRVAAADGAFRRHGDALCTRVAVSLRDTLALDLVVTLPWGERVRLRERDPAGRPVVGWRVVRGAGMHLPDGARGDLFVRLDVVLPDTWDGVDLARVAPLHADARDDDVPLAAHVPDPAETAAFTFPP
jgi:hypothetical protein